MITILFSACGEDQPVTTIDLGFENENANLVYTGVWNLDEVEFHCLTPNIVNLSATQVGDCAEDYCHTGSTLEIKKFMIPGNFEYSISPSIEFLQAGDNVYVETYAELNDTWNLGPDAIHTFHPVGRGLGSNCYVQFVWRK